MEQNANVRFCLSATVRRIANCVGFTSSSGNLDAEYPLLEALRTKPGVPWTDAIYPKRKSGYLDQFRLLD